MTAFPRPVLAAACVLALVAACDRGAREPEPGQEAPSAETPAEETPADPSATPLTYDSQNPHAHVRLELPESVRAQPDLHARLYAESVRELRAFAEGALGDRTEYDGDMDLPPYERADSYRAAGETGKLTSLRRDVYEYTGGAHPNPAYGAVIWDKAMRRFIEPAQLFRRGADLSPLDRALCEAVNVARRARDPGAQPIGFDASGGWACPRAAQTPFVLAESTTPGRAGGLVFLIGPYQVGPYAEGGYEIAVPQAAFRALLAPAYADEFAGAPPRAGDITDRG